MATTESITGVNAIFYQRAGGRLADSWMICGLFLEFSLRPQASCRCALRALDVNLSFRQNFIKVAVGFATKTAC